MSKSKGLDNLPLTINDLQSEAFANSQAHGFWPTLSPERPREAEAMIPEKLCLIHSEVSEALEAYRDGALSLGYEGKKPVGFLSELADVMIRVADLAGALDLDLENMIKIKMAYNRTRPHRHGGKKA